MELQLRIIEAAEAWLGYAPGWWQGSRAPLPGRYGPGDKHVAYNSQEAKDLHHNSQKS